MKRLYYFILLLFGLLALSSCTKHQTAKQSLNNFVAYGEEVSNIADQYNMSVVPYIEDNYKPEDPYIAYQISVSDQSSIIIEFSFDAVGNKGVESFTVNYKNENIGLLRTQFNTELFIDIVNAFSGHDIKQDALSSFLDASEEQYSIEKFGWHKQDNELIHKVMMLDFFENRSIWYRLTDDNTEQLTFSGLTKRSTY